MDFIQERAIGKFLAKLEDVSVGDEYFRYFAGA